MKKISSAFTIAAVLMINGACSKAPEQSAQNQTPAAAQANPTGTATTPPASNAMTETAAPTQAPDGGITADAAAPNDLPASVTLSDGSKYKGTLVSKNGSQLTFRGENGATRTFASQDIRSIRFGDDEANNAPPRREPRRSVPSSATAVAPGAAAPTSSAASDNSSMASSQPAPAPAPVAPPPPQHIVIPSGTKISVRTNEAIDSKTAETGQTFSAVVSNSVLDNDGNVAIPRGSAATLVVRSAGAGKIRANDLVLDMQSLAVNGRTYEVQTGDLAQKGKDGVGANKRTAKYAGGVGALGAVIGAIAGGGRGAAIGAASGAAAGAGTQVFTRGSVKVPAESVLTFQLEAPLRLDVR